MYRVICYTSTGLCTEQFSLAVQGTGMETPLPPSSSSSFSIPADAAITPRTPSDRNNDVSIQSYLSRLSMVNELKRHIVYVKDLFHKTEGACKYIIVAKNSRKNMDFVSPPVTPPCYPFSKASRRHVNTAFKMFSKRFCNKFYIPDDVSMCISMLFNSIGLHGKADYQTIMLTNKIIDFYSIHFRSSKDNPYFIPPSLYFLHALNAINVSCAGINLEPVTFKQLGHRFSTSILQYSLFELGDMYLQILIRSLNEHSAPSSLLLDGPPNPVPLTECHARILAARVKRMGILPRDGTMSTAIYRLYFDIIERCNDGLHPKQFDPDMVYSDCLFELKHLVRQGKISMKIEKKNLSVANKDVPATKRRCVVGKEGRRVAIMKRDSSSLVPLESDECESDSGFLNKNETALAQLLSRLETNEFCSFIDVEDAPEPSGAKGALSYFFENLLANNLYFLANGKHMSSSGFDSAVRILEKDSRGTVEEKFLLEIKNKRIRSVHECREIHFKSTLIPAVELSLGKDFPFEATVVTIFKKMSALADADRKKRPVNDCVTSEFSIAGYTVLAKAVTAVTPNRQERELNKLKEVLKVFETSSWNNNFDKESHISNGLVSWLLDPIRGYEYEYPEANRDAFFSYVLDKLCKYFTEKVRTGLSYEKNLFDKVGSATYLSCAKQYLEKRSFSANSIDKVIDAMCYVRSGSFTLLWIIRNAFPDNEDGKKIAFMRMIGNTVRQTASPLFSKRGSHPPPPSTSLEMLVDNFPDMCYMADKDFGVLRECIEHQSLAFYEILALPNVRATINCRYRYYGNAPAICLGHLMADIVRSDYFVCAFLKNGADASLTTDEGENVMHFVARASTAMSNERKLDSSMASLSLFQEWFRLGRDIEKTKQLFATRRHHDGATPIMVAVAHRNYCTLAFFKGHFPEDIGVLALDMAFGRSDCLRTIDTMVLAGMFFPNSHSPWTVTTTKPSVKLLAKAALEGKLYYNGDSPVPLNRVGLSFDEYAYRGVQHVENVFCQNICLCEFVSGSSVQSVNKRKIRVQSFKHKEGTWCALNYADNVAVDQVCPEDYIGFKKDYVDVCTAIANDDRETLGTMERMCVMKQGNLTYSDGKCAICFDVLNESVEDLHYIEECEHVYHKRCITQWEKIKKDKKKCPTCNTVYRRSIKRGDKDIIVQG